MDSLVNKSGCHSFVKYVHTCMNITSNVIFIDGEYGVVAVDPLTACVHLLLIGKECL